MTLGDRVAVMRQGVPQQVAPPQELYDHPTNMFVARSTLTAVKNNVIWVVAAPTVVAILGLAFAVLTERIRWATLFKFLIFMPMAISFLATSIIFRLVYEQAPDKVWPTRSW